MVRIFHTADVHVGLKFTRGYPEPLQKSLVDERVAVVARMADLANQEQCQLLVVAGDLFDHLRVSKKIIRQTAEALKRFNGLVAVLLSELDCNHLRFCTFSPGNGTAFLRVLVLWIKFQDSGGMVHVIFPEGEKGRSKRGSIYYPCGK